MDAGTSDAAEPPPDEAVVVVVAAIEVGVSDALAMFVLAPGGEADAPELPPLLAQLVIASEPATSRPVSGSRTRGRASTANLQ